MTTTSDTRVLLVEDADDIIELVRLVLDDAGYNLAVATDGEAGRAACAAAPDVILLDMSLPKISGWDLVPLLRADGVTAPIVALTAHAMRGDRERALSLGCSAYLSKPFEIAALLEVLDKARP